MSRILIIEDESAGRSNLNDILLQSGYQTESVSSIVQATEDYALPSFDLIITDLRLPGQPGTDIIQLAQGVPVLVMTNYASLRSAVDAMKLGAVDYIAKPFDQGDIVQIVSNILSKQPFDLIETDQESDYRISDLIYGRCQAMRKVFSLMQKVAPTEATVLIHGETGTGKELAAKAIHHLSRRKDQEYICINCAAIPESLIESELFGHEKGAFTGAVSARNGLIEAADGGTLFLDEIGELPLEAQARLLRVLQEGEIRRVGSTQSRKVNVRLVAATHRNLKALSRTGQFREDLFYRLNVVQLKLPPLRERGNDIVGLTKTLLEKVSEKLGRKDIVLNEDALKAIRGYHWPGNVRELRTAIEHAVVLCRGDVILLRDLPPSVRGESGGASHPDAKDVLGKKNLTVEDAEKALIIRALKDCKGNRTQAAEKIGMSRRTLHRKLHTYNLHDL